ncbi:class I SAM-dependent methyltransferase [Acidisoma cellulosilytica]|uniref:Class I SAM-dependent methyltransferase n=1 Tax=Acidisoma cellulosilyticum TaxID=2802395 RepID=A0A964E754_9PROT|nr:class I SAM-dependent methyltransferase [Acidisoma cellulosilyticum]MCB8883653.1 class I SAM-dependent methyltransferase [Acidisoma cellulosilyticum]
MTDPSYDRAYFDNLYASDPDPWRFRSSDYERAKYAETISIISDRRYRNGLEVGCSIGILSTCLAPLCDSFLGLDISEHPLKEARANCAAIPATRFECMRVPDQWPAGQFDLIVLSEVLYFLPASEIDALAACVLKCLAPGGRVILVNWLGADELPQPGDLAAERFLSAAPLFIAAQRRHALYRIDLIENDQAR